MSPIPIDTVSDAIIEVLFVIVSVKTFNVALDKLVPEHATYPLTIPLSASPLLIFLEKVAKAFKPKLLHPVPVVSRNCPVLDMLNRYTPTYSYMVLTDVLYTNEIFSVYHLLVTVPPEPLQYDKIAKLTLNCFFTKLLVEGP